jgi:hypothetical protein
VVWVAVAGFAGCSKGQDQPAAKAKAKCAYEAHGFCFTPFAGATAADYPTGVGFELAKGSEDQPQQYVVNWESAKSPEAMKGERAAARALHTGGKVVQDVDIEGGYFLVVETPTNVFSDSRVSGKSQSFSCTVSVRKEAKAKLQGVIDSCKSLRALN